MSAPENMDYLGSFWVPEPAFRQLWALQAKGLDAQVVQEESEQGRKYSLYVEKGQTPHAKVALQETTRELQQSESRYVKMQLAEERRQQAGKGWLNMGKMLFALGVIASMAAYLTPAAWIRWMGYALIGLGAVTFLYGYWENNRPLKKL